MSMRRCAKHKAHTAAMIDTSHLPGSQVPPSRRSATRRSAGANVARPAGLHTSRAKLRGGRRSRNAGHGEVAEVTRRQTAPHTQCRRAQLQMDRRGLSPPPTTTDWHGVDIRTFDAWTHRETYTICSEVINYKIIVMSYFNSDARMEVIYIF